MKIALFYYGDFKSKGGTSYVIECLAASFKRTNHRLILFNLNNKSEYTHNLIEKKDYKFLQIVKIILKRNFINYFIFSISKLIRDKTISRSDRIKILLFLILKPNILLNTINNVKSVYPLLKKLDIDLILGGATGGYALALIFMLSRILNKKVASLTYGNDFLVHSSLSLKTFYLRNLDLLILGTHTLKRLIKKIHHLDESKLKVIRYGLILKNYETKLTKQDLRKEFNISENDFILLSVGRHVLRKNFDLVIQAIKYLKEKNSSFKLKYFLIGTGPQTQELKNLTIKLQLENEVKFLGFTDIITRNKYYKLSDVFLMPSITERESIEGFGIVFLEANYYKLPVIGAISGGVVEAIIDGKTGLLVKPNDLNDLVEKILFLCHNEEISIKMGIQGHERVIQDFNWSNIVNDYINVFINVLD